MHANFLYERQTAVSLYPVSYTKDRLQFYYTHFVTRKTGCSFIIVSFLYERQAACPVCYTTDCQTAVSLYRVWYTKDRLQFHYTYPVCHTKDRLQLIIPIFLYERQVAVSLYPVCYTKDRLQFHYTQFVIRKTGCCFLYVFFLLRKTGCIYAICKDCTHMLREDGPRCRYWQS